MRRARRITAALLGLLAAISVTVSAGVVGAYFYVLPELPPPETIRDIPLQIPLRVYSRDGRLISEIGEQRRIPVSYAEIPELVIKALLAAEDDRFFEHPGIDYQGILRAMLVYTMSGSPSQGGSTITQQLARDYFLTRDRLFTRKIREIFLAYRIEKEFTKQEILAMFLNKMFFGQRAYGVAAAAQVFFDKRLNELNAAEAATLAGVLQAPSAYNPVSSPENAKRRRSYVLRRMQELDYLDDVAYEEAMNYPMESELHGPAVELNAPYVAEMVRRHMLNKYGSEIYAAGYEVVTTLDSRLQQAAVNALRNGLLEYDRRHGFRGRLGSVDPLIASEENSERSAIVRQALLDFPEFGGLRVALVTALHENNAATVALRGERAVTVPWSGISWARSYIDDDTLGPELESVDEVLAVGDIVYVIPTVDGRWALAQLPQVQGAFVALDPEDGAIAALHGGFDYSASKFNRALQIRRQPGSSFKPFIYSAALENGLTAATVINDAPIVIASDELEDVWRPINYSGRFHGPTRLREALYRSFNLVSVRVLLEIGLPAAMRHLRKFGFTGAAIPRDTSLALGSGAMSPLELAIGYTIFANTGYKVEPYFIDKVYDALGNELERARPTTVCEACLGEPDAKPIELPAPPSFATAEEMIDRADKYRPDAAEDPELFADFAEHYKVAPRVLDVRNAYIISDMMRDVIRRGTGRRAMSLGRSDLSGKTGTSNDRRDAWFAGFNADLVATAWVGFDADRPLGGREEGSRTALPIWIHFMETALDGVPEHMHQEPPGLTTLRISPETGLPARPGDANSIFEIFRIEFAPKRRIKDNRDRYGIDPFNPGSSDPTRVEEPLF